MAPNNRLEEKLRKLVRISADYCTRQLSAAGIDLNGQHSIQPNLRSQEKHLLICTPEMLSYACIL